MHEKGFFHNIFVGGLAFGDGFWSLSGTESDGGTGLALGMESNGGGGGGLEKLSAEVKTACYCKTKANIDALSIKHKAF